MGFTSFTNNNPENKGVAKTIILSFSLLLGLCLLGFFIFQGLKTFSDKDRVVTVKGLAEMDMKATSATIALNFSISGDNLQNMIKQTENKKRRHVIDLFNKCLDMTKIRYYDKQYRCNRPTKILRNPHAKRRTSPSENRPIYHCRKA